MTKPDRTKTPPNQAAEFGTITGSHNSYRVEINRTLAYPIKDVWQALTDPEQIKCWFAKATLDHREGGSIALDFGEVVVTGEVKIFMPPHVLSYTWQQAGERESLVIFELVEIDDSKTLLTVVQTALETAVASDVGAGWHSMLERFSVYLRSGEFTPENKDNWPELFSIYQAMVT